MTTHLLYIRFFFFDVGGGGGAVTGFKIIAPIVGNSRGTLNTTTRKTPKFLEIYNISFAWRPFTQHVSLISYFNFRCG